jgi:hypothetical protein
MEKQRVANCGVESQRISEFVRSGPYQGQRVDYWRPSSKFPRWYECRLIDETVHTAWRDVRERDIREGRIK